MEFVTYLYTMVIFAGFVLLNDDNSFDWAEIIFAAYICVSAPAFFVDVRFRLCQRGGRFVPFLFHAHE